MMVESINCGLLALAWVASSIAFGACVCPRLMRFAPGGDK